MSEQEQAHDYPCHDYLSQFIQAALPWTNHTFVVSHVWRPNSQLKALDTRGIRRDVVPSPVSVGAGVGAGVGVSLRARRTGLTILHNQQLLVKYNV
jgi:hypothetical protein